VRVVGGDHADEHAAAVDQGSGLDGAEELALEPHLRGDPQGAGVRIREPDIAAIRAVQLLRPLEQSRKQGVDAARGPQHGERVLGTPGAGIVEVSVAEQGQPAPELLDGREHFRQREDAVAAMIGTDDGKVRRRSDFFEIDVHGLPPSDLLGPPRAVAADAIPRERNHPGRA
jgi:hypothetical protein